MNIFNLSNKRGISAIVATVLIILITVAAVTIIWAAIIPLVSNQLERGTVCLDATSQVTLPDKGYSCTNDTGSWVQVKLGSKDVNIGDFQLVLSKGGSSSTYEVISSTVVTLTNGSGVSSVPGVNEEVVYIVTDTGAINASSVSIAPIVTIGNKDEICDVAATLTLAQC